MLKTLVQLLLLCLLSAASAHGQDAVGNSNAALQELRQLEQQLAELETRYDSFDTRLLPVLLAMEAQLQGQQRFDEVRRIQNRRMQIVRINDGLESLDLLPILEASIDNHLRLEDWQQVDDTLEHMRHVLAQNHGEDSEAVLDMMGRQSDWYLQRVALGVRKDRADSVLDARDISEEMLDLAEQRFGEDDPRLVPWLYARALSLYHLVEFMNTDNGLGGETIDVVMQRDGSARLTTFRRPGLFEPVSVFGPSRRIPVVEEGELVGVAYLRQARGFIDDIADIAESMGDTELQAMAELYRGDFHYLMEQGSGRRDYRDAVELLLESGVSQARIDRFFARPMVIPQQEFYSRFAELEAVQQQQLVTAPDDSTGLHLGEFVAWHEDLPSTPRPAGNRLMPNSEEELSHVLLDFRINSRGQVSSVDVISAVPDEKGVERRAWRALREINFRPYFVDGRTRSLDDVRIVYRGTLDQ